MPPFRLKSRGPIFAGLAIACCRGFLLNFGVYYAVLEALKVPFKWSPGVAFMARFMTAFAGVIAVTKDLPDIAGDLATGVPTLATKFGVGKVTAVPHSLYWRTTRRPSAKVWPRRHLLPMVGGHALLAGFLLRNYRRYRQGRRGGPGRDEAFCSPSGQLFAASYAAYRPSGSCLRGLTFRFSFLASRIRPDRVPRRWRQTPWTSTPSSWP